MSYLSPSLADDLALARPYDPDARLAGRSRFALRLSLLLVFGFGLASALVPIGGAVIGSGQVGAQTDVMRIAHPTGGTVAAILVHDGEHVRAGQPLIRFDSGVSGAQASLSALGVDQLLARKARLEAEVAGRSAIDFPADLRARADGDAAHAMEEERRTLAVRAAEQAGLRAQLGARITQYAEQIGGFRAQIASLREQQALIAPEREALRSLYRKNLVTIGRLNQTERTAVGIQGDMGALDAQIAEANGRIAEARQQMIQLGESRRSEASGQLAEVNGQLNQQRATSASAADAQARSVLRAPHDGVVEKLAATTIGGVVRPAETILEIVPDDKRQIVEGAFGLADVGRVHAGQRARIRLKSPGSSVSEELTGTVSYVASDRVTDDAGRAAYVPVRIAIDPASLAAHRDIALSRSMPVEIFVQTGSRSMLSYVLRPLADQFARAFRD